MDNEVPYAGGNQWRYWPKKERASLPEPWPEPRGRRRASDGAEYSLRSRVVDVDPLDQRGTMEIRAEMWRDGTQVAEEEHRLTMRLYFKDELLLLLERAGFEDIVVHGGYDERTEPDHDFLVFIARKRS